mmetsp:Transcript_75945/g.180584  ORF Transcript_75945/g.180584 Transcript_75945/m.180584 type:complete len:89 (-) Transcript_75945:2660-2926(-)
MAHATQLNHIQTARLRLESLDYIDERPPGKVEDEMDQRERVSESERDSDKHEKEGQRLDEESQEDSSSAKSPLSLWSTRNSRRPTQQP